MKRLLIPIFCSTLSFASLIDIHSFEASFTQKVTDDRNATLQYDGYVRAQKPQNAVWNYLKPVKKDVYLDRFRVTIVEPEIEQVILKRVESNFDFFMMIKNAKKVADDTYEASFKNAKFIIKTEKTLIKSISYKDEFENNVLISFENQKQNIKINENFFIADYPVEYDVIGD